MAGTEGGGGVEERPHRRDIEVRRKVRALESDPLKVYRQDCGRPDGCEVYRMHRQWNAAQAEAIRRACTGGLLGCADCRERLIRAGRTIPG